MFFPHIPLRLICRPVSIINIPHWDDFVALIKDENCRLAPQKRNVERKNCVEMEIN